MAILSTLLRKALDWRKFGQITPSPIDLQSKKRSGNWWSIVGTRNCKAFMSFNSFLTAFRKRGRWILAGDSKYKFLFTIMIKSNQSGGHFYWKEKQCTPLQGSKHFAWFWHFRPLLPKYIPINQKRWSKRFEGLEFDSAYAFQLTRNFQLHFSKEGILMLVE